MADASPPSEKYRDDGKESGGESAGSPVPVSMGWSDHAKAWLQANPSLAIESLQTFHKGRTTTIHSLTVRLTKRGNHALVMQGESGAIFAAVSKSEGGSPEDFQDRELLGWVRKYDAREGQMAGERWAVVDRDVDLRLEPEPEDSDPEKQGCDDWLISRLSWRELRWTGRETEEGELSWCYTCIQDGEPFALFNKGVKYLQSGLLQDLNPRAKSPPPHEKTHMTWVWLVGDAVHFWDKDSVEYSVAFGEPHSLGAYRRCGEEGEREEPVWMDSKGIKDQFTGSYLPAGLLEHVTGRNRFALPIGSVMGGDFEESGDAQERLAIEQSTHPDRPDRLTFSWLQPSSHYTLSLEIDKRVGDGVWEPLSGDVMAPKGDRWPARVAVSCSEQAALIMYCVQPESHQPNWKHWFWIPLPVVRAMRSHMKGRKERAQEGDMTREVLLGQPPKAASAAGDEETFWCWICDRHVNSYPQLVDHIEGAGGGSKSHTKARKRWAENGKPSCEVWLRDFVSRGGRAGRQGCTCRGYVIKHGRRA